MAENMSVTLEELTGLIKESSEKISYQRVYFTLKEYGLKIFREATVDVTRLCLACRELGIPITPRVISSIAGNPKSIYTVLHKLGDCHILLSKRKPKLRDKSRLISKKTSYEYIVHPAFAKLFDGEEQEQ